MLWNVYKKVFFVAMGVAVVCGILFRMLPEHQDILGMIARISLAVGWVPLCGILAVLFFSWIRDSIANMEEWPRARSWGHIFTIPGMIGLMLLMCMDGPDVVRAHQETDIKVAMIWAATTFGLLGLGWFINHVPTSSAVRIDRNWNRERMG